MLGIFEIFVTSKIIAEMTKIPSFEEMPSKIQLLLEEVQNLKALIERKNKSLIEDAQYLDIEGVVKCLEEQGYKISLSSVYKLTAERKILHAKFQGKLIFKRIDIHTWAESSIKQEKLCHNRKQKRK